MNENRPERKLDEVMELGEWREEAGNPSQEQITFRMQGTVPSIKSAFIERLGEKRSALEYLSRLKVVLQKNTGLTPSRLSLCIAYLIKNISEESLDGARKAFGNNAIETFRFFYDFGMGTLLTLNKVEEAEDELSDRGEDARLKVLSSREMMSGLSIVEEAEEYLEMKRSDAESLRLLRADPSGFKLMDASIGMVEALPFQAKEYMIAGAELARDLYKRLYEVAGSLYPEKPSE